jgi:hypothetical protein
MTRVYNLSIENGPAGTVLRRVLYRMSDNASGSYKHISRILARRNNKLLAEKTSEFDAITEYFR